MGTDSKYKEGDIVTFKGSSSQGIVTDVLINLTENRHYYRVLVVICSGQSVGLYPECVLEEGAKCE